MRSLKMNSDWGRANMGLGRWWKMAAAAAAAAGRLARGSKAEVSDLRSGAAGDLRFLLLFLTAVG
jgi:hypothetical protein